MAGFVNRIKEFLGLGDEASYEEPEYTVEEPASEESPNRESRRLRAERLSAQAQPEAAPEAPARTPRRSNNNNVIGLPNANAQGEVLVVEPKDFDEAPRLVQYLRERRSVVLNLNLMDPEKAQRTVDVIAGATYALDGHQQRLGDGIFLFTPRSVQITSPVIANSENRSSALETLKFELGNLRSGT